MDHREAAAYLVDRLVKEHPGVVRKVILYGSVARGQENEESDVDLVIVGDDYRAVHRALVPILGRLLAADAPLVSTMVFTTEEFAEMARRGRGFYRTLVEEGKPLLAG